MMKKIYVVIGTRAQFIKVAPMLRMMLDQNMKYELIFTAQHQETIDEILKVYRLPKPDKVLYKYTEANTRFRFARWFLNIFFKVIFQSKKYLPEKGYVLTHGDTFTAWLAALMGKLAGCKVCHLESGLRSYNIFKPFPEEISRLITFTLSDVYFCPNAWAVNNLKKFKGEKINMKENPMYDGVVYAIKNPSKKTFPFQKKKYAIVSIHRYENIFSSRFTEEILPQLKEISRSIHLVFTLHPTTRERLKSLNLYKKLEKDKNIELHERFDFLDWIRVCNESEFVITDGGSNQEELSYLGVPTILFRTETERKEGLGENIVLSELKPGIINNFVENYKKYKRPFKTTKISPSQTVINYLKKYRLNRADY
ncbi:UDP-N-acetylglucosamine 2-epimerase [Candidatus Dojkabacteria bacterium]|nr:UDP-N-acetylglucosamine 2-epimerase [Candidatus Dojkabacteria bacterium]